MSYISKLETLRKNALNDIKSLLKQRGTNYELIDPSEYDDEISDKLYDLPRSFTVSKHGYYDEYPIIAININKKKELSFEGIGCMNENNDDHSFSESELSTDALLAIADLICHLEMGTYYQPEFTKKGKVKGHPEAEVFSFQVWSSKKNLLKKYPKCVPIEYNGDDIEDPTFMD